MKKTLTLLAILYLCQVASAQQKVMVIGQKKILPKTSKAPLSANLFTLTEFQGYAKSNLDPSSKVKTISGKEITMDEYLRRINEVEKKFNVKGVSLRNYNLTNDINEKIIVSNTPAKVEALNQKTILSNQVNAKQFSTIVQYNKVNNVKSLSQLKKQGNLVLASGFKFSPKTIEQNFDLRTVFQNLTNNVSQHAGGGNNDMDIRIANAYLKVISMIDTVGAIGTNLENTNTSFKVDASFNANMGLTLFGFIPVDLNLATMTGEFVANTKTNVKNKRRVVVNILGRSIFNKTSAINSDDFEEEDQNDLNISEITNFPTDITDFIPFNDLTPFNLSLSTMGSVGSQYSVNLSKTHVDANVGPTYALDLSVSGSYGIEDVLEGGIEGIITIARGGLGFGGNAGLSQNSLTKKWTLTNKAYVNASLDVLQGEINFFTRYPDPRNWSCSIGPIPAPCIKKDTYPIYKTPVAFKLRGMLREIDKSETIN
jgi:hypothetical protein